MTKMIQSLKAIRTNESGATAIEYGLIAALIAVVIIGAVSLIGTDLVAKFGEVSAAL
ncbi:MAG: Flp family type IVb pilin [Rhodospirillaceae bacterium]